MGLYSERESQMPHGDSVDSKATLTRSSHEVDASLFRGIKPRLQIPETLERDFTPLRLQDAPEHIERNRIETHGLDFLEYIQVKRLRRHPRNRT